MFPRPPGRIEVQRCQEACQQVAECRAQIQDMDIVVEIITDRHKEILADDLREDGDDHRNLHVPCRPARRIIDVRQVDEKHREDGIADHLRAIEDDIAVLIEAGHQEWCQ